MESDCYSLVIGLFIGFIGSAIVIIKVMAFRKPQPIGEGINFEEQSVASDRNSLVKRSKIYDKNDFLTHLFDGVFTLDNVLSNGSKETVDGNCLGSINKTNNTVEWLTYAQVLTRVKHFGDGLIKMGLKGGQNTCVGIYATNCVDYVITEYGSYSQSCVVIPLYDTLGPNACRFIINKAEICCVVCDKEDRFQALLSQANNMPSLQYIVIINDIPQSYKSKAINYGIKVFTIKEVELLGENNPIESLSPKPEDLALVCYTSGTTDLPKGVMLSHKSVIVNICAVLYQMGPSATCKTDTLLSFLPLAHMFERCCEAAVFMVGGKTAYFSGDIKTLSDDMKIVKPTIMAVVPRLLSRIYDKCYENIKGNKLKEWMLKKAIASKQSEIEKRIVRNNGFWDKLVFKRIREGLGGKMRLIVCGAAPLPPNVLQFMRCALGCIIVEGYGQTECVCPCSLTIPGDSKTGHVGPPLPCCEIRLESVPEMEYNANKGKGEICVRGPIVFDGYFKDTDKSSKVLTKDGWLKTGDIGQWLPNGTLKIIDRKKHIFKLSQGEYIAPEKIETVYSKSQFIAQIFIYGESLKSCLVAVIVPEVDILNLWCRKNNIRGTLRDLCQNTDVKKVIMNDLISLGNKEGLLSFEQPKDIYIHYEAFTIDNGLLTPTLKSKRLEIRNYFGVQLENMYRSLN
ncbi:long-chain-fatty-acid--CoA ligase 1-like [Oppia nitens]|uniref:long-chain-fatty-acid--CoA ligase 1-like n=1 Tax=Oppia nitens TaxID=1686743 RepID=UPI0023DBF3D8|nr:long-chain-fatty-acid--CoA ligase 1-like [Oppia nitens]